MPILIALVNLAILVATLVDIIRRPEGGIRFMPKVVWLIVVILLPFIGSVLWWILGREYAPRQVQTTRYPERMAPPRRAVDTRTTEQQLADLEREEREAKLREEIARRRAQRGE
ncbi:PLD nuclease N-terminal domain-containing protein [Microbacterium karelineae]|uniref:PLD nuclease N-terminal domain-containing protein n=1 Tax=Microbacterium karelineae TaxID=2654283 RepID=UPI0012EA1330|nr:PLD nuclease N-terminal domain-containing protein [Microbacterium karelineae]